MSCDIEDQIIFGLVLKHATDNIGKNTNKYELINYLNEHSYTERDYNEITIRNLIRRSFNFFIDRSMKDEAHLIPVTYKSPAYYWKILNGGRKILDPELKGLMTDDEFFELQGEVYKIYKLKE